MIVEVPCNIGDYIYQLDRMREKIEIKKISQIDIHIGRNGTCATHIEFEIAGCCRASDFGTTVFADRIEALSALDKLLSRKKT